MITQIHHVAILTADIDRGIPHYADLLGSETREAVTVKQPGLHWRTVLLPLGNGTTALQLIEPHEGPGREQLERCGEGTLFEIGLACDNIVAFREHLCRRKIPPSDLREMAIDSPFITSKYGNRYFIVPRNNSLGTRLEIVQLMNS